MLNYSKAAEQLHISHQALSKQIQQLEQECGARLLERSTTKVSLTEVGQKLYDIYTPVLREFYRAEDEFAKFVKYKKDTLRIGYFSTLSYSRVIEPIIQFFQNEENKIRVDILATDIGLVKQLLEQDSIDLAISLMFDEKEWEGYPYVVLHREPLRIIVSDKHPWYEIGEIKSEDFENEKMLVYENRPVEGNDVFFPQLKVKERVPVRNSDSYMNMLRQGNYFGIIGENYSRREGIFKLLPLPKEYEMEVPVVVAFKKLHPCADVINRLKKML